MGSGITIIGRIIATPQYPNGVGAIQGFSTKDGSMVWQVPVLFNGQAVAAVPRITPYSVNGKEYIVSFMSNATAGNDVSAFALP